MNEEAEDVRPIIDRNGDDAAPRHARAIITRLRAIAVLEASAEDVHEHRKLLLIGLRRCPHVEIEAVLAHAAAAEPVVGARRRSLHTAGTELIGIADATP